MRSFSKHFAAGCSGQALAQGGPFLGLASTCSHPCSSTAHSPSRHTDSWISWQTWVSFQNNSKYQKLDSDKVVKWISLHFDKHSSIHALLPAAVTEILNRTPRSKSNTFHVSATKVGASSHIMSSHLQHPKTHH